MVKMRIGDLCTWSKGFQVPRDNTSLDKPVPYLHYGDLYKKYDFRLDLDDVIDSIIKIDENSKVKPEQFLHDGDIVFTLTSETVDDLGHCTLVSNPSNIPFVSGMETTVFHIKGDAPVVPAYLNYCFQSVAFQRALRQYVTGMKVYRVHPDDIMNMELNVPPVSTQEAVVSILDSISDAIIIKSKLNDNLLKLLDVEFQKIKNENPSDFILSDICSIVKKRSSSDFFTVDNYYSTENMLPDRGGVVPAASLPSDQKATICEKGDVIISNIRPYFKKIHYCTEKSGCSADVICFRSLNASESPFLYCVLRSDEFFDFVVSGSKGTKMPRGDKDQMMEYPIAKPPEDVLRKFNSFASTILSQVSNNNRSNLNLTTLRETILPKLMSGEIDVSSLEIPS